VDSLVNIVETGGVGCLFFIPGIDETLRLNGQAIITTDAKYLSLFRHMANAPKSCLKIAVNEVFIHCAKAFMRSKLWGEKYKITRPGFPTIGTMLNDQLGLKNNEESQEDMVKRYLKDL
jgi:predicted pyridoxine 5'-phosphate oxidase superfamily flavin-nucleotide-binding protein